jgi:hypothetical protein
VLLGAFVLFFIQTRNELERTANPEEAALEQSADLSKEVSVYLEFPHGETPTVAMASDAGQHLFTREAYSTWSQRLEL